MGQTRPYYENRVLEHEGVSACTVIPRYAGVGTVGVVVAGPAGPADEELIAAIQGRSGGGAGDRCGGDGFWRLPRFLCR